MGHFVGIGEKSFYVEGKRMWGSVDKRIEYDPETFEAINTEEAIVEDLPPEIEESVVPKDDELSELKDIRREELGSMQWGKLRKLHKSVTGSDERNLKKAEIIEGIIDQEFK